MCIRDRYYNGELPQYITKDLEKRWYFLCGKVRGDDGMPTDVPMGDMGDVSVSDDQETVTDPSSDDTIEGEFREVQ